MKKLLIGALCAGLLLAVGCGKKAETEKPVAETKTETPKPETKPPVPMTKAKGDTITTDSGLKYIDIKVGDGAEPKLGQSVQVHYTGWLLENGKKFDSSKDRNQPFVFPLGKGKVIKGWDEGVGSMKIGGYRQLILPPELGYGARGAGAVIPANAWLVFDVELLAAIDPVVSQGNDKKTQ